MAEEGKQQMESCWDGDVLSRKSLADFLTASLVGQIRAADDDPAIGLTVALDAEWGTGKTFFVKRWSEDLRQAGFPVVFFDAWENDIGDEAAIALMAQIKAELDDWSARLPKKQAIQKKASAAAANAVKGLRRAIAPTSKVIASGLMKKLTGVAISEVMEAAGGSENDLFNGASTATTEALELGLDELFNRALKESQLRNGAIKEFKNCIGALVAILEAEANAKTPIFVFVDEVDRCRPTYAITLLEEIKHIFGMPKLCFVVSTNLAQLQESVRAVYGGGFDAHRYLKRFFEHQYTLTKPNNIAFATQLFGSSKIFASRRVACGLPDSANPAPEHAMALVSDALALDLRSQQQIFSMAVAVAAAIPQEKTIFVLWLLFLCGLQHRKPGYVDELRRDINSTRFRGICEEIIIRDEEIRYPQESDHSFPRRPVYRTAKLSDVLLRYYEWSRDDLKKLHDRFYNSSQDYPESNLRLIAQEAPNPYDSSRKYPPSIGSYTEWVKYAGMAEESKQADGER